MTELDDVKKELSVRDDHRDFGDHPIELEPSVAGRVQYERAEAQRALERWGGAHEHLKQISTDPVQSVLSACGVTRSYLQTLLLDAEVDEPAATITCEASGQPEIAIKPDANSRLARTHDWDPSEEEPLIIPGESVSAYLAAVLGTSNAAGSWLWRKQCGLFNEWSADNFQYLFSGLDVNELGGCAAEIRLAPE